MTNLSELSTSELRRLNSIKEEIEALRGQIDSIAGGIPAYEWPPLPKDDSRRKHDDLGRIAAYIAAPLALFSLFYAVAMRLTWPDVEKSPECWQTVGAVTVGAWVLLPPVWFWLEWVFFSKGQDAERLKHTHDLSRNIWIALVIVLAALLKIHFSHDSSG